MFDSTAPVLSQIGIEYEYNGGRSSFGIHERRTTGFYLRGDLSKVGDAVKPCASVQYDWTPEAHRLADEHIYGFLTSFHTTPQLGTNPYIFSLPYDLWQRNLIGFALFLSR